MGDLDLDRFGVSESTLHRAREMHRGVLRIGTYVPTRAEVATMPPAELIPILFDWLWESPSEIIPTDDQVREVMAVIESRPDADDFSTLIVEFRHNLQDD